MNLICEEGSFSGPMTSQIYTSMDEYSFRKVLTLILAYH